MNISIVLYLINVLVTVIIGIISVKKLPDYVYVNDLIFITTLSLIPCGFVFWIIGWLILLLENSHFGNKKLF